MTLRPFLHALSSVFLIITLASCDSELSKDQIDPAGGLTRKDYLAMRHRQDAALPNFDETAPPIPTPPMETAAPPPPHLGHNKRVSVTVTDSVPVRDVLIELARKANVNLELDPRVQGGVIFSAHDQPFDKVLERICALAGLRARQEGDFVHVELDEPFQKSYALDYLSLARKSTSETSIATNVFDVNVTNGGGGNGTNSSGGGSSNGRSAAENNSVSKVSGTSETDFWGEVEKSLAQIINSTNRRKTDKDTGTNFSIDRQAGMVTVFGDSHQQDAVNAYFIRLRRKANAQVLIDARIIEVQLDTSFKSGIDWQTLFRRGTNLAANFSPTAIAANGVFTATVDNTDFSGILSLVRGFGTTRVLSSPRLTVLNNQTAVLKVATNQVYFITQAQFTTVTNANGSAVTTTPIYTSTPRTVPVGLVMTVQPSIDTEHNRVTMTLRPTISRVVGNVTDPSIGLNAAQQNSGNPVQSQIPVLAVREMDSVIRLRSGEVAVMGGLMQDSSINSEQGIPGADTLPVFGNLAKSRDDAGTTTELVILLRATIADAPGTESADDNLYYNYNNDPRPLPLPHPPSPPLSPTPPPP
jgi:general secretion pathway protein D